MCGDTTGDFDAILSQSYLWINEEHARREAEAAQATPVSTYSYAPHETHVEANVSVRQSVKIVHQAPMSAKAILALLPLITGGYLLYIAWPYRALIVVIMIILAVLAALIGLLRLTWPLIDQIRTNQAKQRLTAPAPHDDAYGSRYQSEQEMYLYQRR